MTGSLLNADPSHQLQSGRWVRRGNGFHTSMRATTFQATCLERLFPQSENGWRWSPSPTFIVRAQRPHSDSQPRGGSTWPPPSICSMDSRIGEIRPVGRCTRPPLAHKLTRTVGSTGSNGVVRLSRIRTTRLQPPACQRVVGPQRSHPAPASGEERKDFVIEPQVKTESTEHRPGVPEDSHRYRGKTSPICPPLFRPAPATSGQFSL